MTALLYPLLALSLALGGCATSRPDAPDAAPSEAGASTTTPDAASADSVRIGVGESVAVEGVAVRFTRVVEDSRCPPDVSCVWAGRAHVELVIGGETHVLSAPGYGQDEMPSETTVSGLTVRVSALAGPRPAERPAGEAAPVWIEIVAERAS